MNLLVTWNFIALAGAFIWLAVLLLPWRPWSTREFLDSASPVIKEGLGAVTVLIPARNENEAIETTLSGLTSMIEPILIVFLGVVFELTIYYWLVSG